MERVIDIVLPAVLGSGGVVGIFFLIFRWYIEKTLSSKEEMRKKFHEYQVKRDELLSKKEHCQGRFNFWVYKAIVSGEHNGDLKKAFDDYQAAEMEQKTFERHQLAELWNEE